MNDYTQDIDILFQLSLQPMIAEGLELFLRTSAAIRETLPDDSPFHDSLDQADCLADMLAADEEDPDLPKESIQSELQTLLLQLRGPAPTEFPAPSSEPMEMPPRLTPEPTPEDEDDSDEALFTDYLAEMDEYVETIEIGLLDLEDQPGNLDHVQQIFRLFHSVKGTAGVFQHLHINVIAHRTEDLLDEVRSGKRPVNGELTELLFASLDMIKGILELLELEHPDEQIDEAKYTAHLHRIDQALAGCPALLSPEPLAEPTMEPTETVTSSPVTEPATPESTPAITTEIPLKETKEHTGANDSRPDEQLRIAAGKLDHLIDMVGELVIASNLVREDELTRTTNRLEFRQKVGQLSGIVSDLQRTALSLRMVPIGNTLNKMKRIVRDYQRNADKPIDIVIEGADTEIDRSLVDHLYEPLIHLVRNACDHGLEPPAQREAAGKPANGRILLRACHVNNMFAIEIADDGRGLDRTAIFKKAVQLGLVAGTATLGDDEVLQLILRPGFSTAATISDISGRGVGLDVVRQALKNMGGNLTVKSEPGKGSVFRITLPLTLSILEGMLFAVGQELFVLPVAQVESIVHPRSEDIVSVFEKGRLLDVRGTHLPLISLAQVFDMADSTSATMTGVALVIHTSLHHYALYVDSLRGIQDVVVKSLGPKFQKLPGVAGSTILGNGCIGLILDPDGLFALSKAIGESRS